MPLHDGWIVRMVFRPEPRDERLVTWDCVCLIHVRGGEPVRMMIPEGVAGVVLVLCAGEHEHEHEHEPCSMVPAQIADHPEVN